MEGAEAEVPRKKTSNNLTHAAERHCPGAAGRRAPTHRPSPRAGRGAITWDLKIRDRNGIRPRLAENGTQEPGEVSLPPSPKNNYPSPWTIPVGSRHGRYRRT